MNFFAPRDAQNQLPGLLHLFDIRNVVNLGPTMTEMERPSLVKRASESSSSASATCTVSADSNTCAKPTDATATLPIALGIAVPVTIALILVLIFHRKYKKKLRAEDQNDEEKYKSMDFGMDINFGGKKKGKKGGPVEQNNNLGVPQGQHVRGLSLEDESPYFFPGVGRNSVDSLASLGRSLRGEPYIPGGPLGKGDDMSIRSPSLRTRRDTDSTAAGSFLDGNSNLLGHAQGNPRSRPPRGHSLPSPPELPPTIQEPEKAMLSASENAQTRNNGGLAPTTTDAGRDSYMATQGFRKSNNYLAQFIHSREPSMDPHADTKSSAPQSPDVDSTASTLLGSDKSAKISVSEILPTPVASPLTTDSTLPATRPAPGVKALLGEPQDSFHSAQASVHDTNNPSYNSATSRNSTSQQYARESRYSNAQQRHEANHQKYGHDSHTLDFNPQEFGKDTRAHSHLSDASNYDNYGQNSFKVTPPSPPRQSQASLTSDYRNSDYRKSEMSRDSGSSYGGNIPARGQSLAQPMPGIQEQHEHHGHNDGLRDLDFDINRLSVLMRPLPPDEGPDEPPEERANRIRSFYKEYFDDSKNARGPPQQPHPQHHNGRGDYYEDYDGEYLSNGYSIYDQKQQGFVVGGAPFAQPITRRAMTPPPRAPPQNFRSRASSQAGSQYGGYPPRVGSSMSGYGTPRVGSSMSNHRPGPGSERGRSKKPQGPPPAPLMSLKTPALLKDDSALYAAFDLAPPPTFRDRQNGVRPDSPLGTERPYSPTVRAHTPLQSAYDELNPMPSPHSLRKSGTFTALDFAPRPRFAGIDTGSDAGSIRSGGSNMSNAQMYALKNGAQRLSRLPKGLAGTKDDIMTSLKPKWDLTY